MVQGGNVGRRWEEGNGRSRLLHVLKPVMLFIFVFYILEMRLEKCFFFAKDNRYSTEYIFK